MKIGWIGIDKINKSCGAGGRELDEKPAMKAVALAAGKMDGADGPDAAIGAAADEDGIEPGGVGVENLGFDGGLDVLGKLSIVYFDGGGVVEEGHKSGDAFERAAAARGEEKIGKGSHQCSGMLECNEGCSRV